MGEPGSHNVNAKAGFYAQFTVLEPQLADKPPRPPIPVRTSPECGVVLVIDTTDSREAQHVIVVPEVIG